MKLKIVCSLLLITLMVAGGAVPVHAKGKKIKSEDKGGNAVAKWACGASGGDYVYGGKNSKGQDVQTCHFDKGFINCVGNDCTTHDDPNAKSKGSKTVRRQMSIHELRASRAKSPSAHRRLQQFERRLQWGKARYRARPRATKRKTPALKAAQPIKVNRGSIKTGPYTTCGKKCAGPSDVQYFFRGFKKAVKKAVRPAARRKK